VNNADLLAGNPLGTVHGIAYFAQSNALGWGYRMVDGVFANGQEGSVDLVMGVAGFDNNLGESVFNVSTAYFPYEQGWTGAWVNAAPASFPGTPGTFACSSPDLDGLAASTVSWTSNVATVTLPGVDSATDGMLFVAPTHSGDRTNTAAAFPVAGGWKVTVREDDEPDNLLFTGNSILGSPDNGFQFLYVPYEAPNLVGGHVQGTTGALLHESGGQSFDLVRTAAGQYEVTVYDSDGVTKLNENDGMLIMSVAGALGGLNPNLADRAFLSYEYSAVQQAFVIESLELTGALQPMPVSENLFGDVLTPTDADFYFAWIDFDGARTLGPPVEIPGDFNHDQSVDGEDLSVWSGGFSSGPAGDADGDGDADGNDLLIWQRNVGSGTSASHIGVAVPEPTSALLATLLASSAFSGRHSRSRR
jgi:hypothetical protein